jgi:hypothetical protein
MKNIDGRGGKNDERHTIIKSGMPRIEIFLNF